MKYNKKLQIKQKIDFSNDIYNFVKKINFKCDKKMLAGLLFCAFDYMNEHGIDMAQLKQCLGKNMSNVSVDFDNAFYGDTAGFYRVSYNDITIIKPYKKSDFNIAHYLLHELLHCISSDARMYLTNAGKGKKQYTFMFDTGLIGDLIEVQGKTQYAYQYGWELLNEGVTELLTSEIFRKYFGANLDYVYHFPCKFTSMLYSACGDKLIRAYFDGDLEFIAQLFEKTGSEKLNKFLLDMPLNIDQYSLVLEQVFDAYDKNIVSGNYEDALWSAFTCNFTIYANSLIKDFYKNKKYFLDGKEVKQAMINGFILFSKNIFPWSAISQDFYADLWASLGEVIDKTYCNLNELFSNQNIQLPDFNDKEYLETIKKAQEITKASFFNPPTFENFDVIQLRKLNINKVLDLQKIKAKKYYKNDKYIPEYLNEEMQLLES